MRNLSLIKYLITILFLLGIMACEEELKDTTPPGELVVTDIIPTHGGAKIAYTLPADYDVLFVKAKYVNTLGNEVFKVSSHFHDTIEIDGLNDTVPLNVDLFVVDHHNNHSAAVTAKITPLESYIHPVLESMDIVADLGGVKVSWINNSEKTVHVYLYYTGPGVDTFKIVSSWLEEYSFNITGLDSVEYSFSAMIEDLVGNRTDVVYIANAIPKYEEKINKSSWTLVPHLSVDGNAWEGVTQNFWDDVIDTHENPNDNSYFIINRDANGGALNYPLDIVIDLNKHALLSRLVVWQRAYWWSDAEPNWYSTLPYYYQVENMQAFDIYVGNDLSDWQFVGHFEIEDHKDNEGNVPDWAVLEALNGHGFMLNNVTEPFRYLKFSITSSFGSEINVYGSEITLFGLDNIEN